MRLEVVGHNVLHDHVRALDDGGQRRIPMLLGRRDPAGIGYPTS
jgi:hypothetical protein